TSFGLDPFLSILVTTPVLFGLGVGLQWLFLRPLREQDHSQLSLLVTFAVALGIEGVLSVTYKTTYRTIRTGYADTSFTVGGYQISAVRLYAFVLSVAMLGLLYLTLERTRFGRAIRATVQNPESARLLGVNAHTVAAVGFGFGAATAAAAGAVYGLLYSFNSGSHYDLISRLLSIVILGGLGSIGGSIVGAMVMGVVASLVAALGPPVWSDFSFFAVLLAVLLIRPRGLFGASLRGAL
ncbi:MAG: branched-chain amino acid ABC transporter permease, partial [Actinocrinis sp.]